jgi:hypothetical protein
MLINPTVYPNNIYKFSFCLTENIAHYKDQPVNVVRKIIPADCFVNCSEQINIFCERNKKSFLMVNQVVHVVTTVL